jgi:quercetin dioxygenase-like cupin family protein
LEGNTPVMNISQFHDNDKEVSSKLIFSGEGKVITLRLKEGALLKEHITPVPAILFAMNGNSVFENELGFKRELSKGDLIEIEPNVKHWVKAITESTFILIK